MSSATELPTTTVQTQTINYYNKTPADLSLILRSIRTDQAYMPADLYTQYYQPSSTYSFPTLATDKDGVLTGDTREPYAKFMAYTDFLVNNQTAKWEPVISSLQRDHSLEDALMKHQLTSYAIDLKFGINGTKEFPNHQASVYPEIIAEIPEVYDSIYYMDYIVKLIHRLFVGTNILGWTTEDVYMQMTQIAFTESPAKPGFYKVSPAHDIPGFRLLSNTMRLFSLKNKLKSRMPELLKSLDTEREYRKTAGFSLRLQLEYDELEYSCSPVLGSDVSLIQFHPLKLKAKYASAKNGEPAAPPEYTKYITQFIQEHIKEIRQVFPVFGRVDNIFRLCCFNRLLERIRAGQSFTSFQIPRFSLEELMDKVVYVGTYAHSVSCTGSVSGQPSQMILKPEPSLTNKNNQFVNNQVVSICEIKRGLADVPVMLGAIHHAGLLIKTSNNEHHIVEWGPDGGVLRKINPAITDTVMNETGHNWTINNCNKMLSGEYDPENVKKLMDIITYGQSYDLIANNCQDVKQKVINALFVK